MSAFLAWGISGWLHLAVGVAIGWVVFKRPQWVQRAIDWVKSKF